MCRAKRAKKQSEGARGKTHILVRDGKVHVLFDTYLWFHGLPAAKRMHRIGYSEACDVGIGRPLGQNISFMMCATALRSTGTRLPQDTIISALRFQTRHLAKHDAQRRGAPEAHATLAIFLGNLEPLMAHPSVLQKCAFRQTRVAYSVLGLSIASSSRDIG
jgi:hypothetical protein